MLAFIKTIHAIESIARLEQAQLSNWPLVKKKVEIQRRKDHADVTKTWNGPVMRTYQIGPLDASAFETWTCHTCKKNHTTRRGGLSAFAANTILYLKQRGAFTLKGGPVGNWRFVMKTSDLTSTERGREQLDLACEKGFRQIYAINYLFITRI